MILTCYKQEGHEVRPNMKKVGWSHNEPHILENTFEISKKLLNNPHSLNFSMGATTPHGICITFDANKRPKFGSYWFSYDIGGNIDNCRG